MGAEVNGDFVVGEDIYVWVMVSGFGWFNEFVDEGDRLDKILEFIGFADGIAVTLPIRKSCEFGLNICVVE